MLLPATNDIKLSTKMDGTLFLQNVFLMACANIDKAHDFCHNMYYNLQKLVDLLHWQVPYLIT